MPIYEYKCSKCGHVTEIIQKVSDKPISVCLTCGGRVKKIISPPALQFKGSGWYITDYAQKDKQEPKVKSKEKAALEKGPDKDSKEKKHEPSPSTH